MLSHPAEWLFSALGGRSASGISVNAETADTQSAVFACTELLAKIIASLPLKLYQKTARGREEITDHPAARLVRLRPNGGQTSFVWRAFGQRCLGLRGNFYSRVIRNSFFEPIALVPQSPSDVSVIVTETADVLYRIRGETLSRSSILHIRAIAGDGFVGKAPITVMREALGVALAAEQHGAKFFANDSRPPGILKTAAKLDLAQIAAMREAWQQAQVGENRSKVAVTHSGLEYQAIGFNNHDSQFIETRKFQLEEICRFYGVPRELLGIEGASSWGTGIQALVQGFAKFTLAPLCRNWEEELTGCLLTEAEQLDGFYFVFSLDALLDADPRGRAEILRIMHESGVISANEWRRLIEMPDLPDNVGDIYLQPLNFAPAGSPAASGLGTPTPQAAPASTPLP